MTPFLLTGTPARGRRHLFLLVWLAVAGLLAGRAQAQSPGPEGGTLSPPSTTVCAGFNSGTLTLTGFTGTVLKYQADNGSGYTDIANSGGRTSYTFANLFQTTNYRAVVQNGTNAAVTSTVATVTVSQPPTATINSDGPTRFCQRGTIYLVAGPTGLYSYQFLLNGVDIRGATSQTYTASVTNSGSYSVRVTNAGGCSSSSASVVIQVQGGSVVNLAASGPTTVCNGTAVPLNATVSGQGTGGYTYQFYRNNVEIPGATNPTYQATTTGAYTVVVYNPSTCSATSNTVNVTVNPVPVVSFSYAASSYCVSGASNPTPTVSPAGGFFAADPNLSLDAKTGAINLAQSQPGTYAVTYTSAGSCPVSSTVNVTVTAAPTAGFSYASGTRCAGTTGSLAPTLAAGAAAGTYSATPAGLSLNASTGTIDLSQSQAGTYTVTNTVAAANGCAATSASAQLVISAVPVATLTAGGATTFCQGGSLTLTAGGGAADATYQFLSNGQPISGATSATFTATTSGSYSVTVTNAGGCATTSAPVAVSVNPATTATFSYAAATYCKSGAASATPTVTGTSGGTFASTPGLSLNAGTGAIDLASSSAGTYTVTYTVGGPCPSTGTASVTITAPATAGFSYANAAYCATGTASATVGAGSSAGTFSSTPGLSLDAATGAIDLAASTPGTYTVTNTVAASGGCAAVTATATVTVNPLPAQPALTASGLVLTTAPVAGASYQYFFNGAAIAGATAATYTATKSGAYTVVVTSAAGCVSPASAAVNLVLTATRSSQAAFELTTFPNPTYDGRLTVSLSGVHSLAKLALFNALGQQVLTGAVPAAAASQELDLSGLATGVYTLRATTTAGTVTQRVVLQ
ncbi:MAG: hypothetical protein NVS3B25_30020 [Hymenobacter sp.]